MKGYIFLSLIILALSLNDDLGSHFATNPNNQYGKEKTITIDGTTSGWELDMKIAQNIANNDPRVFAHWSMHEIAIDDYALFAAYDDDYLYLMWEMINKEIYGYIIYLYLFSLVLKKEKVTVVKW